MKILNLEIKALKVTYKRGYQLLKKAVRIILAARYEITRDSIWLIRKFLVYELGYR